MACSDRLITHPSTLKEPMSFEFKSKTPCKLAAVNVRSELHGKEHVPAVDLKITVNAGNSILDQLDPRWAGILAASPHLAPALGGRLNPNFVEFLMGWPIGWSRVDVSQKHNLEESPASNTALWREVLAVRLRYFFESAPRGLQQAAGSGDFVPQLSSKTACGSEPQRTACSGSVQGMQHAVPTQARAQSQIVREPFMPEAVRLRRCEEALEHRAARLKCGGNGVVTLQAAAAFVVLARRSGFMTSRIENKPATNLVAELESA